MTSRGAITPECGTYMSFYVFRKKYHAQDSNGYNIVQVVIVVASIYFQNILGVP